MKTIHFYAFAILMLLSTDIYAQPAFKYGTCYKEITKRKKSCDFVRVSNGKVFYSILNKSGVILRVFDSNNKLIEEKKIKGSFKGERIWWNHFNAYQEIHEIGNKAVLFIIHHPKNIPTVEIISFDINSNKLIERKIITQSSKYKYSEANHNNNWGNMYKIFYDKHTERFILFSYSTNKESKREEMRFILFDTNLNNIAEIFYPIPDKDYKYYDLSDIHTNYSDEFFIAVKVHHPFKYENQVSKTYISRYNFVSKEFVNHLLKEDYGIDGSGVKFQSNSNNGELGLIVSTYITREQDEKENKIERNFHLKVPGITWWPRYGNYNRLFFYLIDTESLTVKVKKQINSKSQMKKFQSPFVTVGYFQGRLMNFEKNKDGTFTIIGEPIRYASYKSSTKVTYYSIQLLNLASDGTIISLQFIPKKQSSFVGRMYDISKYLSFKYIQKDGSIHLFFNGIKSQYDARTEKECRSFSSISWSHTFYVKIKPDGKFNKSFLLSSPLTGGHKFFNVNLFYVDNDKKTVTMEIIDKKGRKKCARLVSFNIDDL